MNNVIQIKKTDPILDQWNRALDKDAAIKTIAFKFFGGDANKLDSYLQSSGDTKELEIIESEYTQPIEAQEYRQLAMF
ncbi:hypothetical protein N8149_00325 [Gammaproteobacteria bacterium]|nr:hypothetical protein [Gammaproteobacteria bacterium]